jgi:hypothetical protein
MLSWVNKPVILMMHQGLDYMEVALSDTNMIEADSSNVNRGIFVYHFVPNPISGFI